jgi:hypothetical protein
MGKLTTGMTNIMASHSNNITEFNAEVMETLRKLQSRGKGGLTEIDLLPLIFVGAGSNPVNVTTAGGTVVVARAALVAFATAFSIRSLTRVSWGGCGISTPLASRGTCRAYSPSAELAFYHSTASKDRTRWNKC